MKVVTNCNRRGSEISNAGYAIPNKDIRQRYCLLRIFVGDCLSGVADFRTAPIAICDPHLPPLLFWLLEARTEDDKMESEHDADESVLWKGEKLWRTKSNRFLKATAR